MVLIILELNPLLQIYILTQVFSSASNKLKMNVALLTTTTIICAIIGAPLISIGQAPAMHIKKTSEKIMLDGSLSEEAWTLGSPADNFWQYFPNDSAPSEHKTVIYMTYDDKNLYVGAKCSAKNKGYITSSLKRDFRAGGSDNITFLFDTFDDQTNAFFFGINPAGVLREGLISNGGTKVKDFSTSWDNKWVGASKVYDDYWICEVAIPFKTLRFKSGSKKWRFNSYRYDTQNNERSTWTRIPRNQWIFNLAFMGDLIWEEPLDKTRKNITVIPYATGGVQRDFETTSANPSYIYDFGGDAKVSITSGLNLDLTFNPDFSQVEVDRQVTDLNRFEIFFPERRQFFLENADLFSNFGSSRVNPFFSRRIGIASDTAGNLIQNPILLGGRVSGKLDNNWRIGLLNMQTAANDDINLPTQNYTVAAIQRKIFTRSNIGAIFVNRQAELSDTSSYNRVVGLDYHLASKDGSLIGKLFYHHSITPDTTVDFKGATGFQLNYRLRKWRAEYMHQYVGDGFDPQVGYLPRKNYFRVSPELEFYFYPRNKIFNQNSLGVDIEFLSQPEEGLTDITTEIFMNFDFTNNARMRLSFMQNYLYLTDDFDPSGLSESDSTLVAGTSYNYYNFRGSYNSDMRKKLFFNISPSLGQYFNGTRYGGNGFITYQIRPYGSVSMNFSYNYIQLPYATSSLILLGPRFDITFSKSLFLTTFFQYNNQANNFNVNARLQWRFRPVSDFFLVYTDNYYATDFMKKNRAIVAKFTYWLNL